jgi:DNA-binding XRE family transcriptional regulator
LFVGHHWKSRVYTRGILPAMTAPLTAGGIWLREQRRALGLTAAILGPALGVKPQTILAVECGARRLTPLLRARAEAYFAKELLREPAGEGQFAPDNLVRVVAWVHPWTLSSSDHLEVEDGLRAVPISLP